MPHRSLLALVALAVVTAGCHGGGDKAASTSTTSRGAPTSTSVPVSTSAASSSTTAPPRPTSTTGVTAPPPTTPCGPAAGTDTTFSSPVPADTALLTAVTGRHTARCTDTVTFAFSPSVAGTPGVAVTIVRPPFVLAGNGAAVTVAGARFYQVQLQPASTFDFTTGSSAFTGSTNFTVPGAAHVAQVVETGAAEGVVTWVIGVGAADRFVPTLRASPPTFTLTF